MQGEDRRGQPLPPESPPAKDRDDHQRRPAMQDNVHQMIAERVVAEDYVFDPKSAMHERIVLQRGAVSNQIG